MSNKTAKLYMQATEQASAIPFNRRALAFLFVCFFVPPSLKYYAHPYI